MLTLVVIASIHIDMDIDVYIVHIIIYIYVCYRNTGVYLVEASESVPEKIKGPVPNFVFMPKTSEG